ncbi:hypothetical protein DL771_008265 [Monosporascus sp. 5C6A]|nr:hypothetical protein DL771_008265 [Monosporascus sp. 5C6A]
MWSKEPIADEVRGRSIFLTGPTKGGIGAETVISPAAASPAMITLRADPFEKSAAHSRRDQAQRTRPSRLKLVIADRASLLSVRKAVRAILNVVVHSMGLTACPQRRAEKGP